MPIMGRIWGLNPVQIVLALLLALLAGTGLMTAFLYSQLVVIAIVGGLLLLLLCFFSGNPRLICLWGLVLSAPLNVSKDFMVLMPHMGGAISYPIELMDCFVVVLSVFLLRDFICGYRFSVRLGGVFIFWGGLILLGCYTLLAGPYRHLAGFEIVRMTKGLLLFGVLVNEVVRVRQFLHVAYALMVAIFLEALVALLQYLFKANLHLQFLGEATLDVTKNVSLGTYLGSGEAVFRVGGLIGHPNLLAAFFAMLLPMLVALLLSDIKNSHKALLGTVVIFSTAAIFCTLSRSGWMAYGFALACVLGLSFVHPQLRRRYFALKVAVVVFGVMVLLVFAEPIIRRLTQSDSGAVDFRYQWMAIAWQMIKDRPLLGFGLNAFVFNSAPYAGLGGVDGMIERYGETYQWPAVHNIYLLTWAEQGTFGFLFFIGFNFYVLWVGWQNLRHFGHNVLFTMNLGLISGFMAIIIDGMASFFIRQAPCARMYWIVVSLICAIYYWNRDNRRLQGKQPQSMAYRLAGRHIGTFAEKHSS